MVRLFLQRKGDLGENRRVSPVRSPLANEEISIIFAAACTWQKSLDPCALGAHTSPQTGGGGGRGETAEMPPAEEKVRLFRGSGAIGGPNRAGNCNAATVSACSPSKPSAQLRARRDGIIHHDEVQATPHRARCGRRRSACRCSPGPSSSGAAGSQWRSGSCPPDPPAHTTCGCRRGSAGPRRCRHPE